MQHRPRANPQTFFALALVLLPMTAWPHAGEDHSGESLATATGTAAGGPIFMPKEVQFEMQVLTAPATEDTRPLQMKTLGTVVIPTAGRAQVHSPFPGRVLPDLVAPQRGTRVAKGQLLARIEQLVDVTTAVSMSTQVAQTGAELRQAEEEAALARKDVERVTRLGEAVSGRRRQEASAALAVLEERIRGLGATLQQLRSGQQGARSSDLRVVEVTSPIDGVIVEADIVSGEYVEPAKMLVEVIDPSVVWVEADIYEIDLAAVEQAKSAAVLADAYPGRSFQGNLAFLDSVVNPESRTVKAAFAVPNPEGMLRDGMVVDVLIESAQQVTGVMIPKSAVSNDGSQALVYVKLAPEVFIARPVQTQGTWDDVVMVGKGVSGGEIVVTQGLYQIRMSATQVATAPAPSAAGEPTVTNAPAPEHNEENHVHE